MFFEETILVKPLWLKLNSLLLFKLHAYTFLWYVNLPDSSDCDYCLILFLCSYFYVLDNKEKEEAQTFLNSDFILKESENEQCPACRFLPMSLSTISESPTNF